MSDFLKGNECLLKGKKAMKSDKQSPWVKERKDDRIMLLAMDSYYYYYYHFAMCFFGKKNRKMKVYIEKEVTASIIFLDIRDFDKILRKKLNFPFGSEN